MPAFMQSSRKFPSLHVLQAWQFVVADLLSLIGAPPGPSPEQPNTLLHPSTLCGHVLLQETALASSREPQMLMYEKDCAGMQNGSGYLSPDMAAIPVKSSECWQPNQPTYCPPLLKPDANTF
mmetsp:Transcript_61711/g.107352  ORF Transcript_61711/g.107352 Transcript_61711/m.107352 type:complete len:122 (+) Transcript_61711:185-550(+)